MPKKKVPDAPARQREDGDFNRRYAVPITLVCSFLLTLVLIIIAGNL